MIEHRVRCGIRVAIVLCAHLCALPLGASVDPDLFDGRITASSEAAPSEVTESASEAESAPEADRTSPEVPRERAESASVEAGEPVSGGSSKQAGSAESEGGSAGESESAGSGNDASSRDFESFGIGGVARSETVTVQSSKQASSSTGGSASTGSPPGTSDPANSGTGSAVTDPARIGQGDYGSELPAGL